MAKILKVRIRKERSAGGCRFCWPESWGDEASKEANIVAYQDEGLPVEYAIAMVPSLLAQRLLVDPDIEEIDEEMANELGRRWKPQQIRLSDPMALVEMVKAALPEIRRLVSAEAANPLGRLLRALDPDDDSELGLRRSKRFEIRDYFR